MRLIAENLVAAPLWLRIVQLVLMAIILFAMAARVYCFWDDHKGRWSSSEQ